jgi:hypothetical protein
VRLAGGYFGVVNPLGFIDLDAIPLLTTEIS